jgi:hypothetical protein
LHVSTTDITLLLLLLLPPLPPLLLPLWGLLRQGCSNRPLLLLLLLSLSCGLQVCLSCVWHM